METKTPQSQLSDTFNHLAYFRRYTLFTKCKTKARPWETRELRKDARNA